MRRGEYKVFPVLEIAGKELARRQNVILGVAFANLPWDVDALFSGTMGESGEGWWTVTEAQQKAKHLWFANLNTPKEFAEAEQHLDALDT